MEETSLEVHPRAGVHVAQGPRPRQEDAAGSSPEYGVFVVADGLGGHEAGDVASTRAVQSTLAAASMAKLLTSFPAPVAETLCAQADSAVRQAQADTHSDCRTTLALLVLRGARGAVAWAGDSRVYRLRGNALVQLTKDHRWGRHGLTRCLGASRTEEGDVEVHPLEVRARDVYLLATDGVADTLREDVMAAVLSRVGMPTEDKARLLSPEEAAKELVQRALGAGSRDNCTALVVHVPYAEGT